MGSEGIKRISKVGEMMDWTTIYQKLNFKNLNPYPVGMHKGLCTEPYCVIKEGTQIPSIESRKLGQRLIDIIIMVPVQNYRELETYTGRIKTALGELNGLVRTGNETPALVDDEKEAITTSIEYTIIKRLEG